MLNFLLKAIPLFKTAFGAKSNMWNVVLKLDITMTSLKPAC